MGYNGVVADRLADIPAPGNAALLSAVVFDPDLLSHLLAMGDHSLSSVLKQVSLHDTALLPSALRMRTAALTARLADGALSLSDAMVVGADEMREGYPCQSMFREYAPFIEQLQLRRLDLACNGMAADDGIALQHVLCNQLHLCHLDLSGNGDPTPDSVMPAIRSASSLTFLSLAKCFEYNNREPILRPISHLSHLVHLDILGCQLLAAELRELATFFGGLSSLTHLKFGSFLDLELGVVAALTHHLSPTMRHLTLSWGEHVSLAQTTYATFPDGLRRLTALTYLCLGEPDDEATRDANGKWSRWPPELTTLSGVFAALAAMPHLSHFYAPQLRAPPRILSYLSAATRLRHLTLTPDLGANVSDLTQLTSLHIRDDPSSGMGSWWCHLKPLVALRRLRIHKFIASLPAVRALRAALTPVAACLQDLELDVYDADNEAAHTSPFSRTALGSPAASAVPLLTQLTLLTRLVVKEWDALGTGPRHLARVLRPLRTLRHLHITCIGPDSVPVIVAPPPLRAPWGGFGEAVERAAAESGEDEEPAHAELPVAAALGAALAALTQLSALRLSGATMMGMVDTISALGALGALRHLEVTLCHLRTPEAAALAALLRGRALPLLEELDLRNNDLTPAAVAELAGGLPAARRLRHLRLAAQCGHEFERPRDNMTDDDTMSSVGEDTDSDTSGGSDAALSEAAHDAADGGSDDGAAAAAGDAASGSDGGSEDGAGEGEGSAAGSAESGGGGGGSADGGVAGVAGMVAGVAGVAGATVGLVAEMGAALMMAMAVTAAGGRGSRGLGALGGPSGGNEEGYGIGGPSELTSRAVEASAEGALSGEDWSGDGAEDDEGSDGGEGGVGVVESGEAGEDGSGGGSEGDSSDGDDILPILLSLLDAASDAASHAHAAGEAAAAAGTESAPDDTSAAADDAAEGAGGGGGAAEGAGGGEEEVVAGEVGGEAGEVGVEGGASGSGAAVAEMAVEGDAAPADVAAGGAGSEHGADDERVWWWLHEETAEKLWQAVLRLPLDKGVEV
eukprot:jgi/Ulvmu1/2263/UM013_0110.1